MVPKYHAHFHLRSFLKLQQKYVNCRENNYKILLFLEYSKRREGKDLKKASYSLTKQEGSRLAMKRSAASLQKAPKLSYSAKRMRGPDFNAYFLRFRAQK